LDELIKRWFDLFGARVSPPGYSKNLDMDFGHIPISYLK
jgi:hypothetical protein